MFEARRLDDGQDALVGTLAHRVLFTLLIPGCGPADLAGLSFTVALACTDRLLSATRTNPTERRALRQRVAGAALTYLRRLLPPEPWRILAVDVPVRGGRIDALWQAGPELLLDEIKTGSSAGRLRSSRDQISRYLQGVGEPVPPATVGPHPRLWPQDARVKGARLLVTSQPEDSRFQPLTGRSVPLSSTGLVRDRCRPPPDVVI